MEYEMWNMEVYGGLRRGVVRMTDGGRSTIEGRGIEGGGWRSMSGII